MDGIERSIHYEEFDSNPIFAWLGRAEGKLESAEATATGIQHLQIESLWSLADWIYPLGEALAAYDDALTTMARGQTYDNNGRYLEAADEFRLALDSLDDARAFLDEADAAYEAIDLSPFDLDVDSETVHEREAASRLDAAVEGMTMFARYMVDWLTGVDHYVLGFTAKEEVDFEVMVDEFGPARDHFRAAHETSLEGEAVAPGWLFEWFLYLSCLSESLGEVSTHFHASAAAALDGKQLTAESEWLAGERSLDEMSCSPP